MPPDDTRPVVTGKETFPAEREFVTSRPLRAPPDVVFAAWSEPHRLARWWGPAESTVAVDRLDVWNGGAWRIVERAPDGRDYPLKGIYQEVAAPMRLVMRVELREHPGEWHHALQEYRRDQERRPVPEMVWVVTLEPQGSDTLLTFRARFGSRTERHAMLRMGLAEAWSQRLDRLAVHLEEE